MRYKRKSLVGKFIKIVLSMVLVFLLFAGCGIYAFSKLTGKSIDPERASLNTESLNTENVSILDAIKGTNISTNVVIYGVDKDEVRTDVIFVAHYDSKTEKISILSVPRDTRVKIIDEIVQYRKEKGKYIPGDAAGNGYCKLNEVYAYAGAGSTDKEEAAQAIEFAKMQLEDLLGIEIDNHVIVDFDAVIDIVNLVGGVDIYVPQDMYWDMSDTGDIIINLKEGYQHLDGDHALQLVRYRQYSSGDVGRVQVQQTFIKTLAEKVLNTESIIKNAPEYINTAYKYVTTDFTTTDVIKYANYLDKIDPSGITMQTIPGVAQYIGNASYYIYYNDQLGETVDMFLRGTTPEIEMQKKEEEAAAAAKEEGIDYISSKGKNIVVANGGYKNGFAAENKNMLESKGYKVAAIKTYNGEKTANTRIVVGLDGMGIDLQKLYSGSEIIVNESMLGQNEDILIILGTEE